MISSGGPCATITVKEQGVRNLMSAAIQDVSGNPFDSNAAGRPTSVYFSNNGNYLYVLNQQTDKSDPSVAGFSIADGGNLTELSGSPWVCRSASVDGLELNGFYYTVGLLGKGDKVYATCYNNKQALGYSYSPLASI